MMNIYSVAHFVKLYNTQTHSLYVIQHIRRANEERRERAHPLVVQYCNNMDTFSIPFFFLRINWFTL